MVDVDHHSDRLNDIAARQMRVLDDDVKKFTTWVALLFFFLEIIYL